MFTRRAKDIQRCLRNIESFTDNQARVVDCDYDTLKTLKIEVTPSEGPYKEGRFIFEVNLLLVLCRIIHNIQNTIDVSFSLMRDTSTIYFHKYISYQITMPLRYPEVPPDVTCITNVYHPNIDPTGEELNVCLSLFDEWESTFGLEDTIQVHK